jgi:hypothetical protein
MRPRLVLPLRDQWVPSDSQARLRAASLSELRPGQGPTDVEP